MNKPKSIVKRLASAASYSRTLLRTRHFRGRGVHSPFVYGIVRNAIMKTKPQGQERGLFDELRARGFSTRRAAQLQNLYTHRGFTTAVFAEKDGRVFAEKGGVAGAEKSPAGIQPLDAGTLCFAMPSLGEADTLALVAAAEGTGATICMISPFGSRARRGLARHLVASHHHTSVDNRGFLLLFTDERLPKQHFKL